MNCQSKYTYVPEKACGCADCRSENVSGDILISVDNVTMRRGDRTVLDNVSLQVHRGDFIAITGPNGGGKTTLLRIMLRLLRPSAGDVEYYLKAKGEIGYLPQKNMIDSQFPIAVREVVASGLLAQGVRNGELNERVMQTLDQVGLRELADRNIGKLSGGQLQRALLGRALISHPKLLVLDEPLSYIDKKFEERFYVLLKEIAHDTTIVLVSHEMSAIAGMANRHIIIDRRLHECSADCHYVPTDCD